MSEFILGDCIEYMRQMPDKAYELAIVDPPYGNAIENVGGISEAGLLGTRDTPTNGQPTYNRFGGRWEKYKRPF